MKCTLCYRRVSKVCRLWYTAAADPILWRDVDLSGERIKKLKRSFVWLCKNRLSQAVHLNLTNWEAISGKEIQVGCLLFRCLNE